MNLAVTPGGGHVGQFAIAGTIAARLGRQCCCAGYSSRLWLPLGAYAILGLMIGFFAGPLGKIYGGPFLARLGP